MPLVFYFRSLKEKNEIVNYTYIFYRFLSTGLSYRALEDCFCISHQTIADIIYTTCGAIWESLKEVHIPQATTERFLKISDHIYSTMNFTNCIGSLDGKHIRIKLYHIRNYKKCFSVHLLAIAVAKCKFILIDVGDYGRRSDSGVFQSSKTFYILEYNLFNVPPRPLPGTSENMSFVLLGDQGYPLKKYLIHLYPTSEDADKINFESCSPHS